MPKPGPFTIHQLAPCDAVVMENMLTMFGEPETYGAARPSTDYLDLLPRS